MASFATLDPAVQAAVQNAANQFAQQAGAKNWTDLLGFYQDPSVPLTPGTATLDAEKAAGIFTNPPFAGQNPVAVQEAAGFFGPNMGAVSNLPTEAAQEAGALQSAVLDLS